MDLGFVDTEVFALKRFREGRCGGAVCVCGWLSDVISVSDSGSGGAQNKNWKSTLQLSEACAQSLLVLRNGCSRTTMQRHELWSSVSAM